jgi:hypothetical protein
VTTMSADVGASALAHGVHHALVLLGLWGLAALLVPHALGRLSHTAPTLDEHDLRVAELRAAVTAGAPGIAAPAGQRAQHVAAPRRRPAPLLGLPLALVASATAAGIHAAVAPPHLREQAAYGAFFLLVAVAQLAWAAALPRPTPVVLRAGIVLQLGLVALWLLTRTAGLPFGLMPEPHPVGPWDLACVAWQVVAAVAAARVLRDGLAADGTARMPGWFDWHPSTRAAVGLAAVSLVLLTLSGAHS